MNITEDDRYSPPFEVTSVVLNLVAEIAENIGRLDVGGNFAADLRLRRINRIKTIQGSLAIEGNTLSETQIAAIIAGKTVLAPQREIVEVKNALDVYDALDTMCPYSADDMLTAHSILMRSLLDSAGKYRHGGVGVMGGNNEMIHVAPPADRVPFLVKELLGWLQNSNEHSLVKSCIFHYEFEFIHPFADGNGRIGRLWQTLILSKWQSVFLYLPIENIVHQHQQEYYQAINTASAQATATPFVEFMLTAILETVTTVTPQVSPQVSPQVKRLLKVLNDGEFGATEIMKRLKLKDRKSFRKNYLVPALKGNIVEMTIPDKPNSRLQQYRRSKY